MFGGFDDVDDAGDWSELACKRQLADEKFVVDVRLEELAAQNEDAECDGKIQVGAVFHEFGGSEVDSDFGVRERESGVSNGAADAVAAFVDSAVAHADD